MPLGQFDSSFSSSEEDQQKITRRPLMLGGPWPCSAQFSKKGNFHKKALKKTRIIFRA